MNEKNNNTLLSAFVGRVLKFKWAIAALIVIITVCCVPGLNKLRITVNIEDFFLEDDPVLRDQEKFRMLFKNSDFVGVLVEADDVFSRRSLEIIKEVGDRLQEKVPLANGVVSLVNLNSPFVKGAGLDFRDGKLGSPDAVLKQFKEFCTKTASFKGELFSKDNRQAWILLRLAPYPARVAWFEDTEPLFTVGRIAYNTVKAVESGNIRLTATGVPVYAFRKEAEMMDDLKIILSIGALVAFLLSVLILHTRQGVFGTLLILFLAIVAVFGVQGWLGITVDSAFMAVPVLLTMGVSIGYTVHISRFFVVRFRQTGERTSSVIYSLVKSGKPVLFTAFTTIVALLSFLFVEIKPIRWVGITSAFCILAVYLFSMLVFPVILSLGKDREHAHREKTGRDFLESKLVMFAHWVNRYKVIIMVMFLIVTAAAVYRSSGLSVDFNAEKMMGTRLPHMKDQVRIGKSEIAMMDTLDLMVVMPEDAFVEPANIRRLELLEEKIRELPLVKKCSSPVGLIKEINYMRRFKQDKYKTIPGTKSELGSMYRMLNELSPEHLNEWVADNYSTARVFIELSDFSSLTNENNIKKINGYIKEIFPEGTEHSFSGATYQMTVMNQYVTRGLVRSVLTALGLITLLMMIVFKSIRLGLIAMVPNVFPVLAAGGLMGILDIPLEFVTMTVAPMIMGLAVDDTIHLFSHLKDDLKQSGNFSESLARTFSTVGLAITETTIILCVTFLVFVFSRVNNIINMGIVSCAGMLAAYLADIFVSPVLIGQCRFMFKKKDMNN